MRLRTISGVLGAALLSGGLVSIAQGESKHVFGIHFFDWGSNVDVMSHRTGWLVEANATHSDAGPNIQFRYKPATAEGYTIIQRLDWLWEQTIPLTEAEQNEFARECANWAGQIKPYCRYYSIGNEVEFFNVTPAIYASCFTKVRNAIKAEQPEAIVIIGHMNNTENQQAVMQIVGRDGYDGVTAHAASSVPTGLLDILDEENARPGVGVYITEFGWVADTNPNSMNVMRNFYLALGQSNASRERQVYCACWYLYPSYLGPTFSLELAEIDNPSFEAATAIGTSVNSFAANPVLMSNLVADIPDAGTSITVSWNTNVPARRQMWWMPAGSDGAGEQYSDLFSTLTTNHSYTITNLPPASGWEVMPTSTRNDYADAGGRRFRVRTGPWPSTVTQTGAGRVEVTWNTDWPMDAQVDYGTTPALGKTAGRSSLATAHTVTLTGLPTVMHYYRIRSSEPNPDGTAPLYMRSPIRTFTVAWLIPADFDEDGDVDQEDFGRFQVCYTGGGIPQEDSSCAPACLDSDEDVDEQDLKLFRACMTGPNVPASTECLE